MSKHRTDVCPGCSRHCTAGHVHCKYGRKYFEKMQEIQPACEKKQNEDRRYKWEKFVRQGGLAWQLLQVSSRSKKALRRQKTTEQALFSALDESEQAQLRSLLGKVSESIR